MVKGKSDRRRLTISLAKEDHEIIFYLMGADGAYTQSEVVRDALRDAYAKRRGKTGGERANQV